VERKRGVGVQETRRTTPVAIMTIMKVIDRSAIENAQAYTAA
jgi:hypothetical protein